MKNQFIQIVRISLLVLVMVYPFINVIGQQKASEIGRGRVGKECQY